MTRLPALSHPTTVDGPARRVGDRRAARALHQRLATGALQQGWRTAVLENLQAQDDLFQYVGDVRLADWRFLLPLVPRGRALLCGGALSAVPLLLAPVCREVVVVTSRAELAFLLARARQEGCANIQALYPGVAPALPAFDLVAGLRRTPGAGGRPWGDWTLAGLAGRVAPGGQLYVEWDRAAARQPPMLLRGRLRRLGLRPVASYWPKPSLGHCEMILPLADRRATRYYLASAFPGGSPRRRTLALLLGAAVTLGLFDLLLPAYMTMAIRPRRAGR